MERLVKIRIEKLPEGVYLATSDDLPGLVGQAATVAETIEIARDVARILLEDSGAASSHFRLTPITDAFDYPLVVNA